jgi:hypothetical protein
MSIRSTAIDEVNSRVFSGARRNYFGFFGG